MTILLAWLAGVFTIPAALFTVWLLLRATARDTPLQDDITVHPLMVQPRWTEDEL